MIGHVQSRKANLVVSYFQMMHSLDSIKLGTRLNAFCASAECKLPVLLEVNVSGESTKYGFSAWDESQWEVLVKDFEEISQLSHLTIRGLMTVPPYFVNPERARPYFEKTRRLREYLRTFLPDTDWSELSMGTSIDFINAVEEGATYVRIGEAILGKREVDRKSA
jgi:pyridoxal phosphate enzyme (YggS family)